MYFVYCSVWVMKGKGGRTFRTLHFSLKLFYQQIEYFHLFQRIPLRVSLTSNTGYSSVLQHYFYQVPHPPDPPLPSPGESRLPEFWIELLFATELSYLKVVLVSPPA